VKARSSTYVTSFYVVGWRAFLKLPCLSRFSCSSLFVIKIELLKFRHTPRPIFFYLILPNSILKLTFSNMCGLSSIKTFGLRGMLRSRWQRNTMQYLVQLHLQRLLSWKNNLKRLENGTPEICK
jgi:hypothetical protein